MRCGCYRCFWCCAIGLALLALSPALAQPNDWPARPVTVVVPFVAGGNTDMMARLAAERLTAKFHQPFVVENLGGAGGVIAAGQVARAAPDGYTLLFGAGSQLTLAPMVQKINYDPDKDLIPVTEFGTGPQILGVRADLPVATLPKANPGKLSYAAVGVQTVTTIAAGVLKARAGLDMTLVPYKGGVQAMADLLAGHVDMYFGNASEMLPHLTSGQLGHIRAPTCKNLRQNLEHRALLCRPVLRRVRRHFGQISDTPGGGDQWPAPSATATSAAARPEPGSRFAASRTGG